MIVLKDPFSGMGGATSQQSNQNEGDVTAFMSDWPGFVSALGRRKRVEFETLRVKRNDENRHDRTQDCVYAAVCLSAVTGGRTSAERLRERSSHNHHHYGDSSQSYFSSADSVTSLTPPAIHHPLLHTDSFSARVLRTLQDRVSVGQTVSYRQLAEMAGNERAVRAVGGAMRRNPVPLLIPCHRVLCSSGAIGGFMGGKGTEIKRWLLQHESPDHLKTPQNVSNPDYS
ncbi:methylated-DNA--protein-cysteine methyltransferase isoform X1 [Pygocentrus nattereri]|uniref:methylated-DNA--protein-cysteine methyltransferase isoform X1 n=1 Tax=Pygocentrus nattereri TaxID=42514 RepID=UPI0018913FE5|nr:methylated-DNA--protein-cysteine methyltransferase isoform X1 [Pygocentrus nattereri]